MNKQQLLFIGAHPDDELYALGTMKWFQKRGYEVSEIVLSCGENGSIVKEGIPHKLSKHETKQIRIQEHTHAMKSLGVTSWKCLDVEDGRIEHSEDVLWKLVSEIRTMRPTIIITHSENDSHPDHIAVSHLVLDAVRKAAVSARSEEYGAKYRVPILLKVEGYIPEPGAIYFDVSEFKAFKRDYLSHYQSQLSESLVRSTESSDTKNGVIFGVEAAEAFVYDPSWPPLLSTM